MGRNSFRLQSQRPGANALGTEWGGGRGTRVKNANMFRKQFIDVRDACALAQGIVDTVREPVLVLDQDLRVIAASRSFYSSFKVKPEDTQGRLLYALGNGQWD